jgi:hypothetical protein
MELSGLPGGTATAGDPCADIKPIVTMRQLKPLKEKQVILLATTTITMDTVFSNGLFQNVFVLYRMFEAMGFAPIFIVNDTPKNLKSIPTPMRSTRMIPTSQILKRPIQNLLCMIEIGMSIDPDIRKFVKLCGGKIYKLYLGNILNIDIETPIFMPGHYFPHHIVGNSDQIWVSPHYAQHAEYAAVINHVEPSVEKEKMIAPYVWDPVFLSLEGAEPSWRRAATPEEEVFVIMEPNISFQKNLLVPVLILNKWYLGLSPERRAAWKGKVVVISGDRLTMVPHNQHNFLPNLALHKDGKLDLEERVTILEALTRWPAATFFLHNLNNEFNYMTLELLWCGFPVLHNSPSWASCGYSYSPDDFDDAVAIIEQIRTRHSESLETYKAHSRILAWRHSPYNPTNHEGWKKLLGI